MGMLLILALTPRPGLAGPRDDYAALEAEMETAQVEFDKAMEAIMPKDDAKLDESKLPPDGRVAVLKKMDALVASSAGTPDGGFIAGQTLLWSLGIEPKNALTRFDNVAKKYPDELALIDILMDVPFVASESETPENWIKTLETLSKSAKEKDIQLGAVFAVARVQLDAKKLPEARSGFERVRKMSPDSEQARQAKGYIFEIENLQIGMPAPDFVAKTLDGKEISLKSLRGKTVLLNFWATW